MPTRARAEEAMQDGVEVLFLDGVGEVAITVGRNGLSVQPLHPELVSTCWSSITLQPKLDSKIKFSDVYAIEMLDKGPICGPWRTAIQGKKNIEMHRFVVHGITRRRKHPSPWVPCEYIFGHKDLKICKDWFERLILCINNEGVRPKNLMVFVHPLCGKGRGVRNWETVSPLFVRAKIKTKVIVTERAGHAYDTLSSLSDIELKAFDGVVAVGGDGLFNEILNGILSSRHKVSYPPTPEGFGYVGSNDNCEEQTRNWINSSIPTPDSGNAMFPGNSSKCDDQEPLLSTSHPTGLEIPSSNSTKEPCIGDQDNLVAFPNDWFRLGIIPSGSTDAIVLSTTGERDPVTSALLIILGRKVSLDIAQVVRWKSSPTAEVLPTVRYAASFAGYGFYGEVIRESEKYRWMGPARYDFSGTMVFLKHRSYEAKVAFLETPYTHSLTASAEDDITGAQPLQSRWKKPRKVICRTNCSVCKEASTSRQNSEDVSENSRTLCENQKWVWSEGRFLSVGAAIISCRNERAPDGLVADAHLSDGFLHLLLIRDCPLPLYLWHLTQFTKKGLDPLSFKFVEHHKTPAFTFISTHDESVWNLDGEMFQASEVSVQACRGLVNLFASGPEV
ncbi:ceramide kinase-like isoform X1 [Miscanthus floridulus]|uniref:ceramide kinase-like isoform X1 n=2 Tax=Miscanthus floridulus TaxID=154761 RepID=UPI0034589F7C